MELRTTYSSNALYFGGRAPARYAMLGNQSSLGLADGTVGGVLVSQGDTVLCIAIINLFLDSCGQPGTCPMWQCLNAFK